ncbi:hypothetical protein O3P69_014686 [Scylla paramamosain]|uniref:MADF domain-containing protein n=1 Tax=Scylla paramamosain TaxID=85552 RepID=A0AAW0TYW1_SCYPA
MSAKKEAEKKFLIEVLGVYRTLPALWRIKSDDYSNRAKKAEAYDILLQKYRGLSESNANTSAMATDAMATDASMSKILTILNFDGKNA